MSGQNADVVRKTRPLHEFIREELERIVSSQASEEDAQTIVIHARPYAAGGAVPKDAAQELAEAFEHAKEWCDGLFDSTSLGVINAAIEAIKDQAA